MGAATRPGGAQGGGGGAAPFTGPMANALGGAGGDIFQRLQSIFGFGAPNALQGQVQNIFANQLAQPTAQQRVFEQVLPALQAQLGGVPGGDVLGAAQPIFQRNLGESLARQRETAPRFASAGQREARTLEQQGLQDFNLFAQNVMEAGRQRQIQAALAAGQLGQGADVALQNLLGGAGAFGTQLSQQQQGPALQLLMQLLGPLFSGGMSPGLQQNPSLFSQIAQVAAPIAEFALGGPADAAVGAGATRGGR